MKTIPLLICSGIVLAGSAGIARAAVPTPDQAAYKQKMHDCVTQMKTEHPDENYKMRHKACHKQLGPSPKATAAHSSTPAPASP